MGNEQNQGWFIDNRGLTAIVFTLFFGWLLSFPFEGQVLYAIASSYALDPRALIFGLMAAHFFGLLLCGLLIRSLQAAKNIVLYCIVYCVASSLLFFFRPSFAWGFLLVASFLAGMCVAAWGFYFRSFTPPGERLRTVADILIYSNILMIAVNMMAIHLLPEAGLAAAIILLLFAFFFALRLPEREPIEIIRTTDYSLTAAGPLYKPLALLAFFVVVITINSGLMYQVINPAFAHHEWLVSWYWALPYIAALYIMKRLPANRNRAHMLYVAMAMIGFAFIFFMILDRSAASYLLVNTLMLGACGIYDLFWWSISGEMLSHAKNPAQVLGIGLAANVLGVLLGGIIGSMTTSATSPSVLALGVVLVTFMILPLLHQRLSLLLENHVFLLPSPVITRGETSATPVVEPPLLTALTEREHEIAMLLSRGRTYKMIAEELFLSENTIKTHIKNIYSKLGIQRKADLVRLINQKGLSPPR